MSALKCSRRRSQKKANANPDGEPLYRHREYLERNYYYGDAATRNGGQNGRSVDAKAMANQLKAYDTSGTDSSLNPTTLDPDEVIDYYISHNANLNGRSDRYKILMEVGDGEWDHLHTDTSKYYNVRQARYYTVAWGGYVKKPMDAEIQADLDQMREDWNNARTRRGWQRPIFMGKMKLGHRVRYISKRFTCDKKVKLWSKFSFNRVPGDTSAGPDELQQPGQRPNYVTRLSYIAREAGYEGYIVTKVPQNEEERIEYPEPESYRSHNYMEHELELIKWDNFKIIGSPNWTGEATRFFKHKKIRNWCTFCSRKHTFVERWLQRGWLCRNTQWRTRHEIPVYQNESVTKP